MVDFIVLTALLIVLLISIFVIPLNEKDKSFDMGKPLCRKCFNLSNGQCELDIAGAPKVRVCGMFIHKNSREAKEYKAQEKRLEQEGEKMALSLLPSAKVEERRWNTETSEWTEDKKVPLVSDRDKIILFHFEKD